MKFQSPVNLPEKENKQGVSEFFIYLIFSYVF